MRLLIRECNGFQGHPSCRAGWKAGRPFHVMPLSSSVEPTLVLPDYHFRSQEEAKAYIDKAVATAPTVSSYRELASFRDQGIPHFIPAGWVDPSRLP